MKTVSEKKLDVLKKAKKKLDVDGSKTSTVSEKVDAISDTISEYIKSDNISVDEYVEALRIQIEENNDFQDAAHSIDLAIKNTQNKIEEEAEAEN